MAEVQPHPSARLGRRLELLTDMEIKWYRSLMSSQEARVEICLSLHPLLSAQR